MLCARLTISGPVQFVLGDSALSQPVEVPLAAYDSAGRPVTMLAGLVKVLRTEPRHGAPPAAGGSAD